MKNVYDVYFKAGNEPLHFMYNMYSDNDNDIIKGISRHITDFTNDGYGGDGVNCQYLIMCGNRRVFSAAF